MSDEGLSRTILLVDDDPLVLKSLGTILKTAGFQNLVLCETAPEVSEFLEKRSPAAAIVDLKMPNVSGLDLLELLQRKSPWTPVIIISGTSETEVALECLRRGAFDYIEKPAERIKILSSLYKALNHYLMSWENRVLRKSLFEENSRSRSERMERLLDSAAAFSCPMLFHGTEDAARDLAQALHYRQENSEEFLVFDASSGERIPEKLQGGRFQGTVLIFHVEKLIPEEQTWLLGKIAGLPVNRSFRIFGHTACEKMPFDRFGLYKVLWQRKIQVPIVSGESTDARPKTLKEMTETMIRDAMEKTQGNQRQAAELLGISQQALSKRLKRNSHLTTFVHLA